jgi:hypothetical protein
MNKTNISDIVISIYLADHELGLPEFFVIWNMIMGSLSFTHFKEATVSIEPNFNILQFLSVNLLESQNKSFLRNLKGLSMLDFLARSTSSKPVTVASFA